MHIQPLSQIAGPRDFISSDSFIRTDPRKASHAFVHNRLVLWGFFVPPALLALTTLMAIWLTQGDARWLIGSFSLAATGVAAFVCWRMASTVLRPMREALLALRRLAAGDLTGLSDGRAAGRSQGLRRSLGELESKLSEIVRAVRSGTTSVAATSTQLNRDNEALSQRTQSQVSFLQETAASVEELTAAVRQNADNAEQASSFVRSASERASKGGELMRQVVQTMGSIQDSSRSVADIIGVIDGIAFQTNILALNAAVEAARAGEHGRGFAVVAAEVRVLAQRCATAAREIKSLIDNSADKVNTGGRMVDKAGEAMEEIFSAVHQAAELVSQISVGSREQSVGIGSINQALAQMEDLTQRNAELVRDVSQTAVTLNQQAVTLMNVVAGFDLGEREYGTAEDAVRMVEQALAYYRQHGREAFLVEINKRSAGRFVDRDVYLSVCDDEAVCLAHGSNPRMLGVRMEAMKDAQGRPYVAEIVRAARSRAEGWVDYKHAHPITNQIFSKKSYFRRLGDMIVVCGVYSR